VKCGEKHAKHQLDATPIAGGRKVRPTFTSTDFRGEPVLKFPFMHHLTLVFSDASLSIYHHSTITIQLATFISQS